MTGRLLAILCLLVPVGALAQAPQDLTAVGGVGEVSLTWNEPEEIEDSIVCYRVYRDDAPIPEGNREEEIEHRIAALEAFEEGPSYTDTDVTIGTQYFYRVTVETAEVEDGAVSCGGDGAEEFQFSNEATAVPVGIEEPEVVEEGRTSLDAFDADASVDVVVQGGNSLADQQMRLHYRRGGSDTFQSKPMSQNATEFTGSIPGDQVTERGVEFVVKTQEGTVRAPTEGIFSVRVDIDVLSFLQSGGTTQTAYRMVSFPGRLDDPQLSNLFEPLTPYDSEEWRLFEVDEGGGSSDDIYVEQDDLDAPLQRGQGIWLISRSDTTLGPVQGTSVRTDRPYEISLQEGWNVVGNPFAFNVSRSQLRVENTAATLKEVYGYSGELEMDVSVFEPYRGYLVRLSGGQAGTLVIDPTPSESGASGVSTAPAQTTWQVGVAAQVGRARDGANTFGVAPGASPQIDLRDRQEPPLPVADVSLAFQPSTGEARLARDIRGTARSLHTWTAEVEANASGTATVTASGISSVPRDYDVWLVDPALDLTQNLREAPRYQFPTTGEETSRRLRFLVGPSTAVQQALDLENSRSPRVELLPSVPHPVRSHATFRYRLPEPKEVSLALYDLLGRRVATLTENHSAEAGTHGLTWTPSETLSSGTYLLRLRVGDVTRTRRVVVVR